MTIDISDVLLNTGKVKKYTIEYGQDSFSDKNGDYSFTQISVIASNEKESVIRDATFIDEEGYQIYTVDVYDEVSKHPKNLLADDLKKEAEEAKEEEK